MIQPLSASCHVYALDTIGDLGKSRLSRKLKAADDYIRWLEGVMRALGLDRASVLGFSQGGWIALNFAINAPGFIDQLILVAPNAGLVPVKPLFLLRLMLMSIFPTQNAIDRWAKWNSLAWDTGKTYFRLLSEQTRAGLGAQSSARSGVMPTTFTDEELRRLPVETLLIVGDQEIVNDSKAAVARARALIPNLQTEVIPNARHMLPFDQPDLVSRHVLQFLTGPQTA